MSFSKCNNEVKNEADIKFRAVVEFDLLTNWNHSLVNGLTVLPKNSTRTKNRIELIPRVA